MFNTLLDFDHRFSATLAIPHSHWSAEGWHFDLRLLFLILEWSVHGLPWLIGVISLAFWAHRFRWPSEDLWKVAVLLAGIFFDLVTVGVLKLCVQRPRPAHNRDDQFYEAPVADRFSFPSGHASRAALLAVLALNLLDFRREHSQKERISAIVFIALFPLFLAASRVLLGRHFISDVVFGLFLGVLEAFFVLQMPNSFVQFVVEIADYILLA